MKKLFLTLLIGFTFFNCNSQNKNDTTSESDSYTTSRATDATPSDAELLKRTLAGLTKEWGKLKESETVKVKIEPNSYIKYTNGKEVWFYTYWVTIKDRSDIIMQYRYRYNEGIVGGQDMFYPDMFISKKIIPKK